MQYVSRNRQGKEKEMIEYSNSAISEAIDEYIHSERDRAILKRRLIDGRTYEQLAEEFNFSVSQIKRKIYKGEEIIFSHLPKDNLQKK